MKIGIVTINDDNNYGNRLQNYAVQEIIKKAGDVCYTLKNIPQLNGKDKMLLKFIKYIIRNSIKKEKNVKRLNAFLKFNKNINFTNNYITPYTKKYKKYDYFITGSDQVWNPNFARLRDIDLLSFAKPEQRIAFSASFAIAQLPEECKNKAKKELEETIITLFEFKGDKLKQKMLEEVMKIRLEFPLWEYRGFTKLEVNNEE